MKPTKGDADSSLSALSSLASTLNGINARDPGRQRATRRRSIVIIDRRVLGRECLSFCIAEKRKDLQVLAFKSSDEWEGSHLNALPVAAVLLNLGEQRASDPAVALDISGLCQKLAAPLIVLADSCDPADVLRTLECGARGYIPSSVNIDICIEAIALSMAGGTFVPANILMRTRRTARTTGSSQAVADKLTARQTEVVRALCHGKPNKTIAQELRLRESTVKAHIRTIMKKLKSANRTEVAYKMRNLVSPFQDPPERKR